MVADNVVTNAVVTPGAIFRTYSDGVFEHAGSVLEYLTGGSAGAWTFQAVDLTHGLPVSLIGSSAMTLGAGSALIGKVGLDQTTPGTTNKVSLGSDTVAVSVASLPLPTLAATSTLQTTGNTSLVSLDTKTPTLGQALAASSVPVVLTAAQLAALLPFSTVTANAGTNLNTSLLALEAGGNLAALGAKDFATQTTLVALNAKVTACNTGAVVVSSSALPTGASTAAKQPALGTAGTASADVLTVQGIASMTALKVDGSAVTQPVSGTFWQATQPVSAASLPLPSGASTAAKQPALGTAGTASADVISIQGVASMTPLLVTASLAAAQTLATVTTVATVTNLAQMSGVAITLNKGASDTGTQRVTLGDGSQVIGAVTQSGTWNVGTVTTVTAVTAITNALPAGTNTLGGVTSVAATTGGATPYHYLAAASSNQDSQNVKASAGTVYGIQAFNLNASIRYLKMYDKASAPTSADTPFKTILLPGNASGAGVAVPVPTCGIACTSGISFRLTTGQADNDTGAVTAADCVVDLDYK